MAAQGGVSGVAVGMATAGAFLLYVGIQGVSIRDGLKSLVGGSLPVGERRGSGALGAAEDYLANAGKAGEAAGAAGARIAGDAARQAAASGDGARVAAAAKKYVGVPYVLGGTDRKKGLDCSGLVVVAFQDALGITPPRTTYVQVAWKSLRKVDRSQMSAGDLCFWPAGGSPSHVALALDAKNVVHAPRPGKRVEVVPVTRAFTGGLLPSVYRYVGKGS